MFRQFAQSHMLTNDESFFKRPNLYHMVGHCPVMHLHSIHFTDLRWRFFELNQLLF